MRAIIRIDYPEAELPIPDSPDQDTAEYASRAFTLFVLRKLEQAVAPGTMVVLVGCEDDEKEAHALLTENWVGTR